VNWQQCPKKNKMVDRCALKGTTFATCLAQNNKKKNGCLIVCPKLIIATETNAVQPRLWMLTLGGGFHRLCQLGRMSVEEKQLLHLCDWWAGLGGQVGGACD